MTEVKVVLATVLLGLAVYQVGLMAIGYGKVRLRMLGARPASSAHRAIGDTIVLIAIVVALACIFAAEDDGGAHAIAGSTLLAVLALKIVVVRWWRGASRFLPLLGLSLLTLYSITWATSAGSFLFGD